MNIVQELKDEIIRLELRVNEIQHNCSHPRAKVKAKHRDSKGSMLGKTTRKSKFMCTLCMKVWTEESVI